MGLKVLSDYLESPELSYCFGVFEIGNFYFHWSDYHRTCDYKRKLTVGKDSPLTNSMIACHKKAPICLKVNGTVEQLTLFDLYDMHSKGELMPHLGGWDFEVSMVSSRGPYTKVSINSFLNKEIYQQYIFRNLFNGDSSCRDFRLRCFDNCICNYGVGFVHSRVVQIRQLSRRGILFVVDDPMGNFAELSTETTPAIELLIDLDHLPSLSQNSFELSSGPIQRANQNRPSIFYTNDRQKSFIAMISGIQFIEKAISSGNYQKELYFFIPYQNISSKFHDIGKRVNQLLSSLLDWIDGQIKL